MAADAPLVAVVLLLCSLVPSFNCFPQKSLAKILPWQFASEKLAIRQGKILFNGKELNSLSESVSGMWEQGSQSDELMQVEAAWRLTDPSLQCGPTKMKLEVTGRGASYLELDMGSGERSLPLRQLPESCGHLLHQNSLGLVLVVSYGGCNVIQENGYHMLPMSFLQTPVTLACPMIPILVPQIPPNVDRSKRAEAEAESAHDPYHHYHNYLKYLYYLHMLKNRHMYPLVQRAYNGLHPQLVSRSYPSLPMHFPLYGHYQQNPAAPYCHPPGALCPLPHYLYAQHHVLQNKKLHVDPTEVPIALTTKPSAPTTNPPTTVTTATTPKKPCKRITATTTVAPTTSTTKRRCRPRTQPQNKDFTPYANNPFAQEISYNEGGPKSSPHAGSKFGPLLSYPYWQREPWFSQGEDEAIPFDWDDLEH